MPDESVESALQLPVEDPGISDPPAPAPFSIHLDNTCDAWGQTARGLLETETKTITGAGTFATKYTYNSADLPTNMQYPADNANNLTALPSLTYTYHPQMTLDTLGSYVTGTSYDAAGRITSRSLGNGTTSTNTYNPWTIQGGRLSNITSVQSGTTRQNLSYTYDAVGNITQIADALGLTTNYTYDGLSRLDLTTESSKNNPEYDAQTGNLMNLNGTDPNTQYGYNDPEHLHAVTHVGLGNQIYFYDANGNMIQRPNRTLQYNAENQLTAVTGTPSATFVYDGEGNRVKTAVGTTTTAYIGNHTEWNVSTQEMTRYYLAGGQRVAFRVIKSGQADKVFYLLADHLGSTNVVMQVGGVVENKTYTAWGKDRTGSITKTDRQYTGQINESELGLYFYNARYYDPDLGRFTSADSIVPQPGNPLDWDRYGYTRNNPVCYSDPTGHWTEDELNSSLGIGWFEKYFGKKSVFEGRIKLQELLLSKNTTDPISLDLVRSFFNVAYAAHRVGFNFSNVDALGARVTISTGVGGTVAFSGDVILNIASGQLSGFVSPEGGVLLGEGLIIVGGITIFSNMTSNDDFRETSKAIGILGGSYIGINGEESWGYNPYGEKAFDCTFIGVGPAAPSLGIYGSLAYAREVLRVDSQGYHWSPNPPTLLDALSNIGEVLWNDILHIQ